MAIVICSGGLPHSDGGTSDRDRGLKNIYYQNNFPNTNTFHLCYEMVKLIEIAHFCNFSKYLCDLPASGD